MRALPSPVERDAKRGERGQQPGSYARQRQGSGGEHERTERNQQREAARDARQQHQQGRERARALNRAPSGTDHRPATSPV